MTDKTLSKVAPLASALVAAAALACWLLAPNGTEPKLRVPGTDAAPEGVTVTVNPVLSGKLIPGEAKPSDLPGNWTQFRGPNRDGHSTDSPNLLRSWNAREPRVLWSLDVGCHYERYANLVGCLDCITQSPKPGKRSC